MNTFLRNGRRAAFTLVEMLVVISIIGVLAGLIFAVLPGVLKQRNIKRLEADHAALVTAIENYKAGMGFYPPGNRNSSSNISLFYEIKGVTVNAAGDQFTYQDDDPLTSPMLTTLFGVEGIANASGPGEPRATDFFPAMQDKMVDDIGNTEVKRFVSGVTGADGQDLVFQYDVTSTDRHNAETFDLWIDYVFRRKPYRIANW